MKRKKFYAGGSGSSLWGWRWEAPKTMDFQGNEVVYQQRFSNSGDPYVVVPGYLESKLESEGEDFWIVVPVEEDVRDELRKKIKELTKGPVSFWD